jgi:cellulose synthase/poly-beta-1,6-N-acetylglucosamine synthase-like glycosyltransferase
MIKTPLPATRHNETDTDKFFTYLASHVTRSPSVQPIATISQDQSARRTWTTPQITVLCILATMTIIALWTFGIVILTAIFAAVTVLYVALLCLSASWMIALARATPSTPFNKKIIHDLADAPWPSYTILCPLYREKAVVPQFVNAMKALDYPSDCLQVLFLTEEDDEETREAILALKLPTHFQVVTVPQGTPKTKPRACNYGLQQATGEYVVIFDAEDIPDPLQLKKAVLTFASTNVNVACLQAKLNFYNPVQNLLTRFFTIEYSLWFDLILSGLQRLGFSLPLGGTSNHFRISALKALGGWDAFNVTEDCDLGLKLAKYGFRTIMLDSTTYEEANSRKLSWIRQRSRWIKGYMQTYLVHTRHPLSVLKNGKIKDLLSLHLFVGAGSIILLINPVMWAMFAAYLIWRPVALYHQLFPWPVLYAGMLCFLVGNFLPIYVSMIACVKREQYTLVKWCLLLPLYWVLASVAAFLAAYELIVKPHHWHKTQHGLHLQDKKSTDKVAAIQKAGKASVSGGSSHMIGNVTQSVRAISTMPVPAVNKARGRKNIKSRDPWLLATIALACVCSVAATTYFFLHHEILLYGDAYSHLRIARSVFDNVTPGLVQLGDVWLPLPHILMWPFIWNDYLWRTGLAGSFVSMPCYVFTCAMIFLASKKIIQSNFCCFIGTTFFMFNPNILYLQSSPLSESVCFATFSFTVYMFFVWIRDKSTKNYVLLSVGLFLVTLTRYDGWFLYLTVVFSVMIICLMEYKKYKKVEGNSIFFLTLSSIGVMLWLVWGKIIFGDPFYFRDGPFSARVQQLFFLKQGLLYGYHNLIASVVTYTANFAQVSGLLLCFCAVIGILACLLKRGPLSNYFYVIVMITPLFFYVLSLYTGDAAIFTPWDPLNHTSFRFFNVRYGSQMVVPMAILSSVAFYSIAKFLKLRVFYAFFVLLAILQPIIINNTGNIVLQDGQNGFSCEVIHHMNGYIYSHYSGGEILVDVTSTVFNISQTGVEFKDIIYDGSGPYWRMAIKNPSHFVNWVIVSTSNPNDMVSKELDTHSGWFLSSFNEVYRDGDVIIYHLKTANLRQVRAIPSNIYIDNNACKTGNK